MEFLVAFSANDADFVVFHFISFPYNTWQTLSKLMYDPVRTKQLRTLAFLPQRSDQSSGR